MREPRKVVIVDLKQDMVKAVENFKNASATKAYPEHVIVYRTGVCEGEYAKVLVCFLGMFENVFCCYRFWVLFRA